jgi:acetolactate synthase I/II/III large subunit
VTAPDRRRTGGDLVIESLRALGAECCFGVPGQHALALFDALGESSLRYVGCRTELTAAFAADGYARATGTIAPLFVSTGPGALMTLAALQEAAVASVPMVGISSQIPSAGLGGRRRGFLHELPNQVASFRDVVKSTELVQHASQIPSALARAWEIALTAPAGPTWVEVPQDVLVEATSLPPVTDLAAAARPLPPRSELIAEAARLLAEAENPVILAGGGVARARAESALVELAEALGAPVATTFGAKGSFPWEHPLSLRSWLEDAYTTRFLEDADVLLCVGTGLGELSTNYHTLSPKGHVIQVEADAGKLEANYPALAIHADARLALEALVAAVPARPANGETEAAVAALLARVEARLESQSLDHEQGILESIRSALPDGALTYWDMTILAYWAWSAWDARTPGTMHSPQASGCLGYGFPAALGGAAAHKGVPVLAISGDGGAMYSLGDLATARQHDLPLTWLIVDDGGYGILREYMEGTFGRSYGTELDRPDFVAVAESFGIPGRHTTVERLADDLAEALGTPGPTVVVLPTSVRMFAPTHAAAEFAARPA